MKTSSGLGLGPGRSCAMLTQLLLQLFYCVCRMMILASRVPALSAMAGALAWFLLLVRVGVACSSLYSAVSSAYMRVARHGT
jgi:hypothetical protein